MDIDERIAKLGSATSELTEVERDAMWSRIQPPTLGFPEPGRIGRRRTKLSAVAMIAATLLVVGGAGATGNKFLGGGKPVVDQIAALDEPPMQVSPMPGYLEVASDDFMPLSLWENLEKVVVRNDAYVDDVSEQFGDLNARESSRLLLDFRDGDYHVQLFVAPTSKGYLCYATAGSHGSSSCVRSFSVERPTLHWFSLGEEGAITLIGLAADEVEGVSIVTNGRTEPAEMGRNAFIWRGDVASTPKALLVELTSGSEISVPAVDIRGMEMNPTAPIDPNPER